MFDVTRRFPTRTTSLKNCNASRPIWSSLARLSLASWLDVRASDKNLLPCAPTSAWRRCPESLPWDLVLRPLAMKRNASFTPGLPRRRWNSSIPGSRHSMPPALLWALELSRMFWINSKLPLLSCWPRAGRLISLAQDYRQTSVTSAHKLVILTGRKRGVRRGPLRRNIRS